MAVAISAAISPNTAIVQKNLSFPSSAHQILGGFSKRSNIDSKIAGRREKKKGLVGVVMASASERSISGGERFYINFTGFPFPLGPFLNRSTTRTELHDRLIVLVVLVVWSNI